MKKDVAGIVIILGLDALLKELLRQRDPRRRRLLRVVFLKGVPDELFRLLHRGRVGYRELLVLPREEHQDEEDPGKAEGNIHSEIIEPNQNDGGRFRIRWIRPRPGDPLVDLI